MAEDVVTVLQNYYHVLVGSLLGSDVDELPVVDKDMHVEELLRYLMSRHHLWVVDSKDTMKLIGLVTEKDVLDIISPKSISPYSIGGIDTRSLLFGKVNNVGEIATKNLVTADSHDTVETALHKMKRYHLRRLPVVKDGRLIGEITLRKLLEEFMKVLKWYRFKKVEKEGK